MQVTLNQAEIEKALINYVGQQGISITGKNVDVTLVAGRSPNGMTASINISNDGVTEANIVTTRTFGSATNSNNINCTSVVEASDVAGEPTPVEEDEAVTAQRPLFGA
jgi:hypothetical protein